MIRRQFISLFIIFLVITGLAYCDHRLKDKVAIITGASKGIGRGIAKVFAAEGAHAILISRTEKDLENVVSKITKNGGKARYVVADITKPRRYD